MSAPIETAASGTVTDEVSGAVGLPHVGLVVGSEPTLPLDGESASGETNLSASIDDPTQAMLEHDAWRGTPAEMRTFGVAGSTDSDAQAVPGSQTLDEMVDQSLAHIA